MVKEISLGNINATSSTTLKRMLTESQLDRDEHKHSLQVDEPDAKRVQVFPWSNIYNVSKSVYRNAAPTTFKTHVSMFVFPSKKSFQVEDHGYRTSLVCYSLLSPERWNGPSDECFVWVHITWNRTVCFGTDMPLMKLLTVMFSLPGDSKVGMLVIIALRARETV